jgi:hypothetical protein
LDQREYELAELLEMLRLLLDLDDDHDFKVIPSKPIISTSIH